jgi:hypothetical protein
MCHVAWVYYRVLQNGFTFSVFKNVCVVMFIVAERDNINLPAMGENWQGRHSTNHFTVQTVIVNFYQLCYISPRSGLAQDFEINEQYQNWQKAGLARDIHITSTLFQDNSI